MRLGHVNRAIPANSGTFRVPCQRLAVIGAGCGRFAVWAALLAAMLASRLRVSLPSRSYSSTPT